MSKALITGFASVLILILFLNLGSALTTGTPSRRLVLPQAPATTTNVQGIELMGHIGGASAAVAMQGQYAYVGFGPRLDVLDVSRPSGPGRVGYVVLADVLFFEITKAIEVASGYAYVAAGRGGLRAVDISDPTDPTEVGILDTPGTSEDIAVVGNYAYVADGDGGLRVVDISDPTSPTEVGFCDTVYVRYVVMVVGGYAYISDYNYHLRIINVSNPAVPTEIGFYDLQAPLDAVVSGDYAYFADRYGGLRVVDISDPTSPVEVGFYGIPHAWASSEGVAVSGNYAYVTIRYIANPYGPRRTDGFLYVVDILDPANPTEVSVHQTAESAWDVAVSGDYAYVVTGYSLGQGSPVMGFGGAWVGDSGLVVNISDPANPVEAGAYRSSGYMYNVAVSGNYAYVAACDDGLRVVDISAPTVPTEVGFFDAYEAVDVAISGDYAYVATGDNKLLVLGISNPANPIEVREVSFYGKESLYATDVVVSDGYAYVAVEECCPASTFGLRVLDISDPANPVEVGAYHSSGYKFDAAVSGDYAYITVGYVRPAEGGNLLVLDISDPTNPIEVGAYDAQGYAHGVAVSGGHAYVAIWDFAFASGALRVVDISDPTSPIEVGTYGTPGYACDVAVVGNYAYVTAGELRVLDISDPANPTEAHSSYGAWGKVTVSGGYVYVAAECGGLFILRLPPSLITGHVTDLHGAPLSNVTISADTGLSATTDASGQYTLTNVLVGTYALTPTTSGYFWSPANRTVTVPPDVIGQDFTGQNIHKQVTPSGPNAVDYGDPLTYTVCIIYPDTRILTLYDPVPTYTSYISVSLSAPGGVAYDLLSNAISGTLNLTAAVPTTVSFVVRVEITGTKESAPLIRNRACVCPEGSGDGVCSNEVISFIYAWPVYLPIVMR